MNLQNYMIVTVKYSHRGFTLTSGRFTYEDFDGTRHMDIKRFVKNGEDVLDRVYKYLTDVRGMTILGSDNSHRDTTYIVVAPTDNGFVSVSGKFEKRND